jgi:hypothetical protein
MPAVLLCSRLHAVVGAHGSSEWTFWDSGAEAAEALRALGASRCGPLCEGAHLAIWREGNKLYVMRHRRAPLTLAEQLDRLYPREHWPIGPQHWPLDPNLNGPLEASPVPCSPLPDRMARGAAAALAQALGCAP